MPERIAMCQSQRNGADGMEPTESTERRAPRSRAGEPKEDDGVASVPKVTSDIHRRILDINKMELDLGQLEYGTTEPEPWPALHWVFILWQSMHVHDKSCFVPLLKELPKVHSVLVFMCFQWFATGSCKGWSKARRRLKRQSRR